jgi:radical SAM superfamily enzyme YgiQ (UPF0313 family)
MLMYDMPLWRPPSEADNLILQATIGCSYNQCTFCSNYLSKTYRERPLDELSRDIDAAARDWPNAERFFLADGDAFVIAPGNLHRILDKLHAAFPQLARVSAYATPVSILRKSQQELAALCQSGLKQIYLGIESGSSDLLKRIRKGATQRSMGEALDKARNAGIKVSATVILGLGGRRYWQTHIDETAVLINQHPPSFLSTLQLQFRIPGVEQRYREAFEEAFEPQDDEGILAEIKHLVERLNPVHPIVFRSNHASNCLPLKGDLPQDRERLLAAIAMAEHDDRSLRPQFLRGTYS